VHRVATSKQQNVNWCRGFSFTLETEDKRLTYGVCGLPDLLLRESVANGVNEAHVPCTTSCLTDQRPAFAACTGVIGPDTLTVALRLMEAGESADTTGLSLDLETAVNKGLTLRFGKSGVVTQTPPAEGGIGGMRRDVQSGSRAHPPVPWLQPE
jgi:hypothetical protein